MWGNVRNRARIGKKRAVRISHSPSSAESAIGRCAVESVSNSPSSNRPSHHRRISEDHVAHSAEQTAIQAVACHSGVVSTATTDACEASPSCGRSHRQHSSTAYSSDHSRESKSEGRIRGEGVRQHGAGVCLLGAPAMGQLQRRHHLDRIGRDVQSTVRRVPERGDGRSDLPKPREPCELQGARYTAQPKKQGQLEMPVALVQC